MQNVRGQIFVRSVRREVLTAHEFSSAHDEHIDSRHDAVRLKRKDVEVEVLWKRTHLLSHEFVEDGEFVAVVKRDFKILLFGKILHSLFENPLHLSVVAFQKLYDFLNLLFILLFRHFAVARSKASAEVLVEARARGF